MGSTHTVRRLVAAVVTAVALVGSTAVVASPAEAGSSRCVDRGEFKKIKRGFPKKRVHNVFDTAGRQTSFYTIGRARYEDREYKPCTSRKYGFVSIYFKNGKVTDKYVYWG